jgi:GDP-L-fucose synthase
MDIKGKRVLITGGYGFLGRNVLRAFVNAGSCVEIFQKSSYDLEEYEAAYFALRDFQPHIVIHCAALVGGIGANQKRPADFWAANLKMGVNLLTACLDGNIPKKPEKVVMLGSTCSYPKVPPSIPFKEEDLFSGYPEETNAPYGIAKRALIVGAQAFRRQYELNVITLVPTNLYGPGDHFDLENSHVIPALIRKILAAKEEGLPSVSLWGTGRATRSFLYVEDAAEGILKATEHYELGDPVNLASNDCISIHSLAYMIRDLVGYKGEIAWDHAKPDGQPHRQLDTQKAEQLFGFKAKTSFEDGLKKTIEWYLEVRGE